VIALIPMLGVLAVLWIATALGPAPEAEYALVGGGGVDVARTAIGVEFAPSSAEPAAGLIVYGGGRVDHRSYAALAREIVEAHDVLVVIPPMTLDLAILSPDRADPIIGEHPGIEEWVIVGHSLGGVAASSYIAEGAGNADRISALVFLASYPSEGTDLSDSDVQVLSITASEDLVLDREAFEAGRDRLPEDTQYVEIEGGNHAQFGSYGEQPGDGTPTITAEEQRAAVIDAMRAVLEQLAVAASSRP
jgi:hypothetical protein